MTAIQMTKYTYVTKRIDLLGSYAFERHLILKTSLKDDQTAIGTGFVQILQCKDKKWRVVALVEPETQASMIGTTWYLTHSVLGDGESTQQNGFLFIINLTGSKVKDFDVSPANQCSESVQGILSVRVSTIHFYQPPIVFDVLFEIVNYSWENGYGRESFFIHNGSATKG